MIGTWRRSDRSRSSISAASAPGPSPVGSQTSKSPNSILAEHPQRKPDPRNSRAIERQGEGAINIPSTSGIERFASAGAWKRQGLSYLRTNMEHRREGVPPECLFLTPRRCSASQRLPRLSASPAANGRSLLRSQPSYEIPSDLRQDRLRARFADEGQQAQRTLVGLSRPIEKHSRTLFRDRWSAQSS